MPTTNGRRKAAGRSAPKVARPGQRQARLRVETIERLKPHGSYGDTLDEIINRVLDRVETRGRPGKAPATTR